MDTFSPPDDLPDESRPAEAQAHGFAGLAQGFDALSHPLRLELFALLMRCYPQALRAGEIGRILGQRPSTLSAWLSELTAAGLIGFERQGTMLLYRARPEAGADLHRLLGASVLRGRVAEAAERAASGAAARNKVENVLFLSVANSGRSLMAEALLRRVAGGRFEVFSAGIAPGRPAPTGLAMLKELGHDISGLWSKPLSLHLEAWAPRLDYVITLAAQASEAPLPLWPGAPLESHWPLPDPETGGTAEDWATLYLTLSARLEAFAGWPAGLGRAARQAQLDALADLTP